jgi:hypothetical protein
MCPVWEFDRMLLNEPFSSLTIASMALVFTENSLPPTHGQMLHYADNFLPLLDKGDGLHLRPALGAGQQIL